MEQLLFAILAQEGGGQGNGQVQGCGGMGGFMLPMLLMFGIIYFLIIRPQQKTQKKLKAMLGTLKKGEKVVTNAGIFGTITGMTEATLTLEIAKNVHIRILRGQIAGLQPGEKDEGEGPVVPDASGKK